MLPSKQTPPSAAVVANAPSSITHRISLRSRCCKGLSQSAPAGSSARPGGIVAAPPASVVGSESVMRHMRHTTWHVCAIAVSCASRRRLLGRVHALQGLCDVWVRGRRHARKCTCAKTQRGGRTCAAHVVYARHSTRTPSQARMLNEYSSRVAHSATRATHDGTCTPACIPRNASRPAEACTLALTRSLPPSSHPRSLTRLGRLARPHAACTSICERT